MLQATRALGVGGVHALLIAVVSIGCGDSGETKREPVRSMAQAVVAKPDALPSDTAIESESESKPSTSAARPRDVRPEIDFIATEPNGEVRLGDPIRLHVEISGQVAWESEVEIDWRLNGVLIEGEHADVLETGSFAPGDIVVGQARADNSGRASRRISSTPVLIVRPEPPSILSEPAVEIVDGEFRYRLRAESPVAGAVLVYRLETGPDGMRVDPETGLATWRPAEDQEGRFEIDIAVVDQWGGGAAQNFAIDIASSQPPASPR